MTAKTYSFEYIEDNGGVYQSAEYLLQNQRDIVAQKNAAEGRTVSLFTKERTEVLKPEDRQFIRDALVGTVWSIPYSNIRYMKMNDNYVLRMSTFAGEVSTERFNIERLHAGITDVTQWREMVAK